MITFQRAETHERYRRASLDPRVRQIEECLAEVNRIKVEDPATGIGVYDGLIDQLADQSRSLIHDFEHTREPLHWSPAQRVVWRSSRMSSERKFDVIERGITTGDALAYAQVNAGRWIVPCPSPRCGGAQYACYEDRRLWCVDCDNAFTHGQWVPVSWPENPEEIEEVLIRRPEYARNWLPGETIEDLLAQDAENRDEE